MCIEKLIINTSFFIKNIFPFLTSSKERRIAQILIDKCVKISTAESCTGGLISSRLTDVSGSSAYTFQNFVTYANEAKKEFLDVNEETINKYGVVSEEVALEMVSGLLNKYDCNIAIATTGIAGPLGGSDKKPVGLVCIAIGNKDNKKSFSYKINPLLCRKFIKYAFAEKALDLLFNFLKENY